MTRDLLLGVHMHWLQNYALIRHSFPERADIYISIYEQPIRHLPDHMRMQMGNLHKHFGYLFISITQT